MVRVYARSGKHAKLYASVLWGEPFVQLDVAEGDFKVTAPLRDADPVSLSLELAGAIRTAGHGSFTMSLHQLGGPLVDLRRFTVSGGKLVPLMAAYGPDTDRPFTPVESFRGVGTPVDRDHPRVVEVFGHWHQGELWVRPGFPSVCTFSEWVMDGRRFQAALCQSVDVPGGFVLLEPSDVVRVYGYRVDTDKTFKVGDLVGLVPVEPLRRIVSWVLEAQSSVNNSAR